MRSLRCLIFVIVAAVALPAAQSAATPDVQLLNLQPDSREAVIQRAMNFLFSRASDNAMFSDHGGDLVWAFYTISHTARDRKLRATAAGMGLEMAQRWRKAHPHVPPDADADTISDLVASAYAADKFGLHDRRFKAELRRAAAQFTAKDYFEFDAPNEPPPRGDPKGYKMWQNALVITFFGDAAGIRLGASLPDVVKWLPRMRPYKAADDDAEFDMFYSVTHLVYTLDAYHTRRIDPALLPQEIAFLKYKLAKAMKEDEEDPEMIGESLDSLKALGQGNDPLVLQGIAYLLDNQRDDGTWVGEEDSSAYTAYHSAWVAIDGLRDYHYRGTVKKLPRLETPAAP